MAAVFRVAARLGWNEQIGNHNSLMIPRQHRDDAPTFLINPRGLLFQEITASNLLVCDFDGNVLRGTASYRKVAFHIHSRIHMANPAAICVVHVHPRSLTALSMLDEPAFALSHHNNLLLNDRVASTILAAHQQTAIKRAIASLRPSVTNPSSLMGGHGVTVMDAPSPTPSTMFHCRTDGNVQSPLMLPREEKCAAPPEPHRRGFNGPWSEKIDARLHLDAWRRILDREEPDSLQVERGALYLFINACPNT